MPEHGGSSNDATRRAAALALSVVMFAVACGVPLADEKGRQVALAAYGPRPLGLPWPAFHLLLAALLCLPMPAFWSNALLAWQKARESGVVLTGPLSWVSNYPRLRREPAVARPLRVVAAIAVGYLLVAVLWIAYAAYLGI